MERGNRRLQYAIATAVSLSSVTVGVSFSWNTPVLPKIARNEIGFQMTPEEVSWMASISSVGYMVGSFVARYITDRYGRRVSILVSTLPTMIAVILKIFASNAWMLSTARFLFGCATGVVIAASIMYLAEIADKDIRGKISLGNRFMMSFGCLLVIAVGAFVSYNTLNWLLVACPLIYGAACWGIPESPYYLLKEDKLHEARRTLQMLTGITDQDVLEKELSDMRAQVRLEMSRSDTIKEFVTGKKYRKATIIVFGVKFAQIFAGLHAIQNYMGAIILESNSGIDVTTALIIFGACRFLLGIISSLLVDRLGRRPLLIYSFLGTGLFLGIVAVYFGTLTSYDYQYPFTVIPFIGIICALTISVLGFESVSYMMPAEMYPLNVKAVAMAINSLFGGFLNFLSVKTYQPIKDVTGLFGVFTLYSVASILGGIFSYFLVIETKGNTLREIQVQLQGDMYEEDNEKLNSVLINEKNTAVIVKPGNRVVG